MTGSFARFIRPLGVAIVLLAVAIVYGPVFRLPGGAVLATVIGLIIIGCLVLAAYLWLVCDRKFAAVGAVVLAGAAWSAFYLTSAAAPWLIWTVLFFIGVGLIWYDSGKDTTRKAWWPLALLRVFLGWAWIDNAQDHFRVGNWFAGDGGGFAQAANGAANRAPTFALDSIYSGFLKGTVTTNADAWACDCVRRAQLRADARHRLPHTSGGVAGAMAELQLHPDEGLPVPRRLYRQDLLHRRSDRDAD